MIHGLGVQVAVVVGGGQHLARRQRQRTRGMDRTMADYMGMLATIMNGIALQSALEDIGVETRVQTAIEVKKRRRALHRAAGHRHLEKGRAWSSSSPGTGNPFFLHRHDGRLARQRDQGAQVILKATKVDGIYTADPMKDPTATRYDRITYTEALSKRLAVMDSTAFSLCQDNKVPIMVFDMNQPAQHPAEPCWASRSARWSSAT